MKRTRILFILLGLALAALVVRYCFPELAAPIIARLQGKKTVQDRLEQYGPTARARMEPHFVRQRISYPPREVVLVGFKNEKGLQVYAAGEDGKPRFIRSYPVVAASGRIGPKLRYGDCQVPEGIYNITFLNPNSRYHLSLRIGYPNEFDRAMAAKEGREDLGGDIMIHGSSVSVGCLAMGDEAAEDLFVLAADTGIENMKVILSPVDFRKLGLPPDCPDLPAWADELHRSIKAELSKLP